MAWYRQGSVSIEAGSNVVIGTGTKWTVNLYGIGEGQALVVNGERLEIMYVDSDTKIRLALPHEAGYTGNYHIETSYAGTGGDASRQIMAAIRRLTTLSFDWTEWMTSDAATITATDVLGQPVEIATYKSLAALAGDIDSFKALLALDGFTVKDKDGNDVKIDSLQLIQSRLKSITDAIDKIETPSQTIIFKNDVLAKEIGVGYPRNGATPASRFGYYANSATPRLYMTDGVNAATLQFVLKDGIVATREWVNTMVGADIRAAWLINPNGSMWWGAHDDYLYAKQNGKTYVNLEIDKSDNIKATGFLHTMSAGDYTSFKMWRKGGATEDGGVLFQTAPWDTAVDGKTAFSIVEQTGKFGVSSTNRNAWNFAREGTGRVVATRQWMWETTGWGIGSDWGTHMFSHTALSLPTGTYRYDANTLNKPVTSVGFGAAIVTRYSADIAHHLYINNYGSSVLAVKRQNGSTHENYYVLTSNNYTVDGNGFYKKASPIVTISDNGYTTNRESRGATVRKLAVGQYQICNILGYNDDAAWGVNGGISVPKDNNGLELVFVKDSVQADGSIVVTTYHRQHAHLPEAFQNHRIKEVVDGVPVYMQDGEQCDLPAYTRLDVRVGMPQDSIWNRQQYWNNVYIVYSELCRTQQDVLSNTILALPQL